MTPPTKFESVLLAELNLGLPPTFFYKLLFDLQSEDWSFTLKLHALFEGALTRLLRKRIGGETIDDIATFPQMLKLAFEMPVLSGDVLCRIINLPDRIAGPHDPVGQYRNFLRALNCLRNRFAHNANYITRDIRTVLLELRPTKKRRAVVQWLNLTRVMDDPDLLFNNVVSPLAHKKPLDEEKLKKAREQCRRVFARGKVMEPAGIALALLSFAYYLELGKDGQFYIEDFRAQLQDLLHDPAVIELRRGLEGEFPGAGFL